MDASSSTSAGGRGMSAGELSKSEKDAAWRVMQIFEAFRKLRPTMPLQHAHTFLMVAMNEGEGVTWYAEKAEIPQTVMTRHLLDMGSHTRTREPGLGLVVTRMDPL